MDPETLALIERLGGWALVVVVMKWLMNTQTKKTDKVLEELRELRRDISKTHE